MTLSLVRRALVLVLTTAIAGCASFPALAPASATAVPARPTLTPSAAPPALGSGFPSVSAAATAEPSTAVRDGEPWIVYQGGRSGPAMIRLVRPDGSGDHVLAPGIGDEQFHPDWSHDGTTVAFVATAADGTTDLWTVRADGSDPVLRYDCQAPCHEVDDPAWSPDDRAILLVANLDATTPGDGIPTVAIFDLDREQLTTALTPPATEWAVNPRWNPNGDAFVTELDRFGSARFDDETILDGTIGVVHLTARTAAFQALLPWSTRAAYPDWSPTGDRIVAVIPDDPAADPADLVLLSVTDPHPQRITEFAGTGGWGIQPTWTPDGERILFVGEDIARSQANAASVRPDGTRLERMPWDGTYRTHPRLRPGP